jgi:DNA-cytosine methyltransferase
VIGGAILKEYEVKSDYKTLLWEKIREQSKSVEMQLDPLERKRTGSYYTSLDLTDEMMKELVSRINNSGKTIWELRFLEPCVGTGNFVFSYLKEISNLNLEKEKMEVLINNIYVADINKIALEQYKAMLTEFVSTYFNIELDDSYFEEHIGYGLLIDLGEEIPNYIKITDVFPKEIVSTGFDIVVTNPPYKNLKAEKSQYSSDEEFNIDKVKYAAVSKLVDKTFTYSTDGVLNLYKIFVEEIIDNYTNEEGFIDLLIPASILSDKTCSMLRTHMLVDNDILSVKLIGEGSGYIDAQQALCAIMIKRGTSTKTITVTKDYHNNPKQSTDIHINDIMNKDTGNAIFAINNQEYSMLKQLRKFPIVKDLGFIVNSRGELDLTSNKNSIVSTNTGYPLLRGKNIKYYEIVDLKSEEYVDVDFVKKSKKNQYIKKERIICQQVVNMNKERRVTFAYVEPNYVLGNSCNFITVGENEYGIDLYSILGLFNTTIINWFFKLTSSNNHVNNYEIDCFPIPVNSALLTKISILVKEYLKTKDESILELIEDYAYQAYEIRKPGEGIKVEETSVFAQKYYNAIKYIIPSMSLELASSILKGDSSLETVILQSGVDLDKSSRKIVDGITTKYMKLKKGEILNHTTFKLSDLDLEMIRSVPPGGSWKDIPMETVEKSKRLKKITETGGRTTLYGRIDYEKPSYTITTYFNRPGNGTYVHPVHDRVLSVREAARFQSFKDDYFFFGNKTQMLKQVGNAVPTLLAYQIAKNIVDKCNCTKSLDLFCGAGGMTAGFKEAGIHSILSNDIEESACITLKINNPEIEVFCGDITEQATKDYIVKKSLEASVDVICGGPPCQGFSMAGFRFIDDPRNQLFKEFVEVVSKVKPKVIVFENVEGLLSFQGGAVYNSILELFSEYGYYTEGRVLLTSNYGVPQKRKRVIIICTRKDIGVMPEEIFPNLITESTDKQITAYETIADLESVECMENATYATAQESAYIRMIKGKDSYYSFVNSFKKDTLEVLDNNEFEQMRLVL